MKQKDKVPLSVIIITKNEEQNIIPCMATVSFAKEIIVVDTPDRDNTAELARKQNAIVITTVKTGFKEKRELGLRKARMRWILFIDADERVTDELRLEMSSIVTKEQGNTHGYWIPFKHFFLNIWLKYGGWYPDYHLRLVRKTGVHIEGRIHETMHVQGESKRLRGHIFHYGDPSLSRRIEKTNYYTSLQAEEYHMQNRQCILNIRLLSIPFARFFKKYLLQLGFLDGIPGLVRALLLSYTSFILYAKMIEKRKREKNEY